MCTGSESTLVSCGHLGVGVTDNCYHSEDAGVRCYGAKKEGMIKSIPAVKPPILPCINHPK